MSAIKKTSVLKIFIFCIGLIFTETFCFPYYFENGSTGGYEEGTPPLGIQCNTSMEVVLTGGAGYFLQAQATVKTLLNRIELQDLKYLDYLEINRLVNGALIDIIQARLSFEELIKTAEATPYKLEVLEQLNRFDYDTFLRDYGLNPFVFGIVREYLLKGDITGMYKHSHGDFQEIEQLLVNIRASISENRVPVVEDCWRLNERCAEASLFGSYIARIFKAIN